MRTFFLLFMYAISVSASPATEPSSRPTEWTQMDDYKAFQKRIETSKARLSIAEAERDKRISGDNKLQGAIKDRDAAYDALKTARASGTMQQRLDAGAKYNNLKKVTDDLRASLAVDTVVEKSKAELARISAEADEARSRQSQLVRTWEQQQAVAEESERMKDPIHRAEKEHRVVVGMTLDQAVSSLKGNYSHAGFQPDPITQTEQGSLYKLYAGSGGGPKGFTRYWNAWVRHDRIVAITEAEYEGPQVITPPERR